ncbi:hypothetical protein LCGC14_3094030, partial [marine sediment metagenome]
PKAHGTLPWDVVGGGHALPPTPRQLPRCGRGLGSIPWLSVEVRPVQLDIYRTAIPMRTFEHAAAPRDVAEAIVVRMELSDKTVGWGETLPRDYVTGETLDTVPRDIEEIFWPIGHAKHGLPSDLPTTNEGRYVTAARCAFELAEYDAWSRFHCRVRGVGPASYACPKIEVPVSGVLGSADPARTARRLRLMRWYGLRDFKLKLGLGDDVDAENLRLVPRRIGKGIARGKFTLRVDVNGGWSADETPGRVARLKPYGVCVVEQPVFGPPEELIELAQRCELPLMADESMITPPEAKKFIEAPGRKVWLNVRLSKNGGTWPADTIMKAADDAGVPFVVGCMVGESSIL